jgi:K+-transporting ATPase ATPase B chain
MGKQMLITRGALTTFSPANHQAKYFAIVPAMFAATLPWLGDTMRLHSATSAVLAYRPLGADACSAETW